MNGKQFTNSSSDDDNYNTFGSGFASSIASTTATDGDNNIALLWSENENVSKELRTEKERRIMLEASLRNAQLSLNREKQKRKLLESQTSRLTAELTKYLTPSDGAISTSPTQRFANKFKFKKRRNSNSGSKSNNNNQPPIDGIIDDNTDDKASQNNGNRGGIQGIDEPDEGYTATRRKPSMDAKAGWLKFLSSAAAVGDKMKNRKASQSNNNQEMDGIPEENQNENAEQEMNGNGNVNNKKKKSFHLPKQLSLTNIGQKLRERKGSKDAKNNDDDNDQDPELGSVDETKEVDDTQIDTNGQSQPKENGKKHARKATLGQTVMATFKKIQNAAQTKMEERAKQKNKPKKYVATIQYIDDDGDDNDKDKDKDEVDDKDRPKVNADVDDDHIVDEDSSAEKMEQNYRHRIVITGPNGGDGALADEEYDSDDSVVYKGDDDNYSTTGMEIEFAPALEPLPQTAELDTDASY